jgi:hypothetical protein
VCLADGIATTCAPSSPLCAIAHTSLDWLESGPTSGGRSSRPTLRIPHDCGLNLDGLMRRSALPALGRVEPSASGVVSSSPCWQAAPEVDPHHLANAGMGHGPE